MFGYYLCLYQYTRLSSTDMDFRSSDVRDYCSSCPSSCINYACNAMGQDCDQNPELRTEIQEALKKCNSPFRVCLKDILAFDEDQSSRHRKSRSLPASTEIPLPPRPEHATTASCRVRHESCMGYACTVVHILGRMNCATDYEVRSNIANMLKKCYYPNIDICLRRFVSAIVKSLDSEISIDINK